MHEYAGEVEGGHFLLPLQVLELLLLLDLRASTYLAILIGEQDGEGEKGNECCVGRAPPLCGTLLTAGQG